MNKINQIYPLNSQFWDIPLIGIAPDGTETKVTINDKSGKPCVWGWSVWKGKEAYRTLGISVEVITTNRGWKFYQEELVIK